MTLIEAGHERSRFLADLRNCARMHVWPTLTKFCTVTQVRRSMFLWGSATTSSEGAGAPASPGSWDPYLGPYGLTWSHQIWYGNTCGTECVSRGQPRPHPRWACPQRHHPVWPRATRFGMVTHVGDKRDCGGSATPIKSGGTMFPKFMGSPTCTHTAWEAATKLCTRSN